jgi:hypothetical protein
MSEQRSDDQNWHHGSSAADVGTKEWADFVRLQLVAMVEHLGENEESFLGYVELMREHRAWTLMTRKDGSAFKTIEEFCLERRPWGLGTTWARLRPHLVSGMAKRGKAPDEIERALQLETVPEPRPANQYTESATATELPKQNHETIRRLRAITRAPDAVKDAYREGRISQVEAARLGPKNPTPERAAKVAEIAREVRSAPDRKAADAAVRRGFGIKAATLVEQAFRLVERMTPAERLDFDRQIRPLISAAEAE